MPAVEPSTDILWDVISKTALVLALLYGVLWTIRRFSGKLEVARRGPSLQLVNTVHLGPGRSVHLLGIGDRMILVGATSQQVSLLAELDSSETGVLPGESPPVGGFERYLHQTIRKVESLPFRLGGRPRGGDLADRAGSGADR